MCLTQINHMAVTICHVSQFNTGPTFVASAQFSLAPPSTPSSPSHMLWNVCAKRAFMQIIRKRRFIKRGQSTHRVMGSIEAVADCHHKCFTNAQKTKEGATAITNKDSFVHKVKKWPWSQMQSKRVQQDPQRTAWPFHWS